MPASTADLALQTAIFDKLTTTTDVTDLLAAGADSVFDAVPDASDLPYVVIGDHELTVGELKICERWVGKVTINVHAQDGLGPGTPDPVVKQTKKIQEQIQIVINDTLVLVGYVIIVLSVDFLGTDVNPDDQKSVLGRLTYNLDMVEGS